MPVPKRRTSNSKRNKRRAHDAIAVPQWVTCSRCGAAMLRHRVCAACGYYKARPVTTGEDT
ncbi:MAG: 50S ribosomal protein L32 [Deltaproteobacteria bacterium]|nr:50S ribosomal protein L32 [Deltaproteobacteria bacterium]